MSQLGQKAKYSLRAYVFRSAPNNGHRAITATRPGCGADTAVYSIASSAVASSVFGMVRFIALAVFMLITNR
jgi:hypothetical protein